MITATGKERVLQILQRGGEWPTPRLAEAAVLAHNTTIKWINELRKEGFLILDEKVEGKAYNEYWLVKKNGKSETVLELAKKRLREYESMAPESIETLKIKRQVLELESRII